MADPVLGSVWPATGSSLQQKVDTAYQIWRSWAPTTSRRRST